jgi:hypothetical protein
MASTHARGITIDGIGRRTIDKGHRGERIFARLGAVSQEEAERLLAREIDRLKGSKWPYRPAGSVGAETRMFTVRRISLTVSSASRVDRAWHSL